jgi:hypothetical protein
VRSFGGWLLPLVTLLASLALTSAASAAHSCVGDQGLVSVQVLLLPPLALTHR